MGLDWRKPMLGFLWASQNPLQVFKVEKMWLPIKSGIMVLLYALQFGETVNAQVNKSRRDHEHLTEQTLSCSLEKQMGSMSSSCGHVRVTAHTLLPHIHRTGKPDY